MTDAAIRYIDDQDRNKGFIDPDGYRERYNDPLTFGGAPCEYSDRPVTKRVLQRHGVTKTFWRLSEERQKRLLDICVEEFAGNSYKISSTNSIVRKAGISKGLFFKYFASKASVYLHLVRSVLAELGELQTGAFASSDIVARSEELFSRHMYYARHCPSRYQMALRSALETEPTIRNAVERIRVDVSKQFSAALYDGVDWTMYCLPKVDVVEFLRCLDLGLRQAAVESLGDLSDATRLGTYVRKRHRLARAILRAGLYSIQKKEDNYVD